MHSDTRDACTGTHGKHRRPCTQRQQASFHSTYAAVVGGGFRSAGAASMIRRRRAPLTLPPVPTTLAMPRALPAPRPSLSLAMPRGRGPLSGAVNPVPIILTHCSAVALHARRLSVFAFGQPIQGCRAGTPAAATSTKVPRPRRRPRIPITEIASHRRSACLRSRT